MRKEIYLPDSMVCTERVAKEGGGGWGEKSSFMQDFFRKMHAIVYCKQYFMPQKFAREDFESHFSLPLYEIYT